LEKVGGIMFKVLVKLFIGIIVFMNLSFSQNLKEIRPPATPLIAVDPYFSVWSTSDKLYNERTKHWTGANYGMLCLVKIDGKNYRIMGWEFNKLEPLEQKSLKVLPTRTVYEFEGAGVNIKLTFLTPSIAYDINLLSLPLTYLIWDVRSIDSKEHSVQIYFDVTAELVVNEPSQKVIWSRSKINSIEALRFGTSEQPILDKKGDNLRIDWGFLYLCSEKTLSSSNSIAPFNISRENFIKYGTSVNEDDLRNPRPASDSWPVLSYIYNFENVKEEKRNYISLIYDDIFSIQYFYRNLKPYWSKIYSTNDLIKKSISQFQEIYSKCVNFDEELVGDLIQVGGQNYATVASLAYRQGLAANKIAIDIDGTPLMFPKENFSNGCISTVDVIYPASPFYLLFNTKLLKAQLTPLLEYCKMNRWKFPFAPHDLGTYPKANGQVYGGGEVSEEDQMPVEESGNMIIMIAAISKVENNVNFALKYWDIITKWAEYLKEKGLDPENQLCTDDFAGHLAHNTNLSIKAIIALDCYAFLCKMAGKINEYKNYHSLAKEYVEKWVQMADDKDHYRLAFDKPNTWSQKYNLIWDKVLQLNLFPEVVFEKELKFYLTKINKYGLPLDNRKDYTKLDWILWTASLYRDFSEFDKMIAPLINFINDTPDRVPLTDWFWTNNAKQAGFQARSVVSGVFIKMLTNKEIWKKWNNKK
jgi:hypothetical protein